MKKILTVIVVLCCLGLSSYAQEGFQDVIYLKSGGIIRGTMIEQIPGKSIKLQTADRNVFIYQMEEIEKITKEQIDSKHSSNYGSDENQSGYLGILEFSYGMGLAEAYDMVQVTYINGYRFNSYFSLGFGTGIETIPKSKSIVIPFYADLRGYFLDGASTPYLGMDLGYSLLASPEFQGLGMLVNPSLGGKFQVGATTAVNVGLGYLVQFADGGSAKYLRFTFGISF